ncbi:MAG TPA: GntR family transcriptional regulator [Variovorax sp.]|jgi:DNA-binding GntR family transcriptional regulator|nr:GntR family transcriptional regulator [Variovorax sp.]
MSAASTRPADDAGSAAASDADAGPAPRPKAAVAAGRRAADSVSEQTYQALLALIASRALEPGDAIEERRLAERFDVSRTPMRAAISRLLGEGVLQQRANGLLVVREVGLTEYLELLSLRVLLEGEAAALAAARAPAAALARIERRLMAQLDSAAGADPAGEAQLDEDIHELVVNHCGNRSLGALITDIHRRLRMRDLSHAPQRLVPACEEHLAVVRALAARDPATARRAMVEHLERVRASHLRHVGILPGAPD